MFHRASRASANFQSISEHPRRLWSLVARPLTSSIAHSLPPSLAHSFTHSTHSLTSSLPPAPTHSLTHSAHSAHSLTLTQLTPSLARHIARLLVCYQCAAVYVGGLRFLAPRETLSFPVPLQNEIGSVHCLTQQNCQGYDPSHAEYHAQQARSDGCRPLDSTLRPGVCTKRMSASFSKSATIGDNVLQALTESFGAQAAN